MFFYPLTLLMLVFLLPDCGRAPEVTWLSSAAERLSSALFKRLLQREDLKQMDQDTLRAIIQGQFTTLNSMMNNEFLHDTPSDQLDLNLELVNKELELYTGVSLTYFKLNNVTGIRNFSFSLALDDLATTPSSVKMSVLVNVDLGGPVDLDGEARFKSFGLPLTCSLRAVLKKFKANARLTLGLDLGQTQPRYGEVGLGLPDLKVTSFEVGDISLHKVTPVMVRRVADSVVNTLSGYLLNNNGENEKILIDRVVVPALQWSGDTILKKVADNFFELVLHLGSEYLYESGDLSPQPAVPPPLDIDLPLPSAGVLTDLGYFTGMIIKVLKPRADRFARELVGSLTHDMADQAKRFVKACRGWAKDELLREKDPEKPRASGTMDPLDLPRLLLEPPRAYLVLRRWFEDRMGELNLFLNQVLVLDGYRHTFPELFTGYDVRVDLDTVKGLDTVKVQPTPLDSDLVVSAHQNKMGFSVDMGLEVGALEIKGRVSALSGGSAQSTHPTGSDVHKGDTYDSAGAVVPAAQDSSVVLNYTLNLKKLEGQAGALVKLMAFRNSKGRSVGRLGARLSGLFAKMEDGLQGVWDHSLKVTLNERWG